MKHLQQKLFVLMFSIGGMISVQADPNIQNIQVNASTTKKFAGNKQNEPSLAQNPTDHLNLIAGANDQSAEPECTDTTPSTCLRPANTSFSGFYASKDGGTTWTCQGLIDLGPNAYAVGDPWQTFDSQGNAYYGTLAMPKDVVPFTKPADFYVAKSTDKGCSYTSAVKISGNAPAVFDDKDAIASDSNPNSPFHDNVYAAWRTLVGPNGMSDHILFSRSIDDGKTWTNPMPVSRANAPDGTFRSGAAVKVGPDGTVYVAWLFVGQNFPAASTGTSIYMTISHDGGLTFPGQEILVANLNDKGIIDALPGASFRTQPRLIPQIGIDPNNGRLYVAWSEYTSGHGVVKLTSSSDGLTWSNPVVAGNVPNRSAFFSTVAVDPNSKVNVVFQALDDVPSTTPPIDGSVTYDTYFTQSTNNGLNWSIPQKITDVSSDPAGSSREPLAVQFLGDYITAVSDSSGGKVFAVWTDARNAVPCTAVDDFRIGTGTKPNVITQCDPDFGNTDIYFAAVPY